ncbi:MAG TPA: RagB/SusD family nutrient uptake outer membrane protein [Chitinophaga sp.]|uniref:RagB/SusD family nutrient uptake outer membrane protein n=1 Tax=Chitinophaga sp. TaxID=1869181 RepID=UPI002CCD0FF0|nr:RagB/SusD family nutrient uptake outer membrane protein [Chitinophaga sp.]HVI45639.1 RagB/SusD family nutrient uptake outer membrane protein [Chitinophaga sp.]
MTFSHRYKCAFILGLLFAATGFHACTRKFEDYNTDPNKLKQDMLEYDNLKISAFFSQLEKNVIPAGNSATDEINQYQVSENLQGDIWSGYMGVTNNWNSGRNNSNYNLIPGWTSVAFNNMFNGVMPAWKEIKKETADKNPNNTAFRGVFAMAQIIKVFAASRTTDMYGPLPYFSFGNGGTQTPYDGQQEIYASFFKDLDSSMNTLRDFLSQSNGASPKNDFDLIYGGDYSRWLKFANTLKLRLAMRIVYADAALAKQRAEQTVSNGFGFIEVNANNAMYKGNTLFILLNPIQWIADNYGDIRMGAPMESFLKGYNDPRLPLLFNAVSGEYRGIRTGIDIVNKSPYAERFSSMKIASADPLPWMVAAESYFLRAEGALRGWNMGGTAQSFYEQGVTTAFDQVKATGAAAYLANSTAKPAPYTDPVATSGANNVAATSADLPTITIKWAEGDGFETKLERIMTQKWIALYPDGQEAWSEFRRTRYPRIFPVVRNYSGGTIDQKKQIKRIPFTQNEYQTNAQGVAKGVQLLGGADNGGTALWWDKK